MPSPYTPLVPFCQVDAACQEHATVIHVAVDPTGPPTPAAHLSLLSCTAHTAPGRAEVGQHTPAIVFTYRLAEPPAPDPLQVIVAQVVLADLDEATADEYDGMDGWLILCCPACGGSSNNGTAEFYELDQSHIRQNTLEVEEWVSVSEARDGRDMHTIGYACDCGQAVDLPDADECRTVWG